jgi:glycosyltransferase involved in cell wall biosynthesis
VSERLPVTLMVGTRNAGARLRDCMGSCAAWVSEILVVDMESDDETRAIAGEFGAAVVDVPAAGFVEAGRQAGIERASQPWILVLDADERAGPRTRELVAGYVARGELAGVELIFKNHLFGRWIRHSGYWPETHLRLFRAGAVEWPPAVHAQPRVEGLVERAPADPDTAIEHFNYDSVFEWVDRNNRYTDIEAAQLFATGERTSLRRLLQRPAKSFFVRYVLWKGFRDGPQGLAIAVLMAVYTALLELKLGELERRAPG